MNTHQFLHTLTAAGAALSLALACGTARADNFDYEHQKERRLESGASQSPIDIASKDAVRSEHYDDEKDDIVVHAARGGASVIDNGHTVQVG